MSSLSYEYENPPITFSKVITGELFSYNSILYTKINKGAALHLQSKDVVPFKDPVEVYIPLRVTAEMGFIKANRREW